MITFRGLSHGNGLADVVVSNDNGSLTMASHETFVPLQQEPKFRVRRPSLRSRTDDGTHDQKKEDLLALPPVRGKRPFRV